MRYDTVIKNGRIITASESYTADIAIEGDKIAAIGENLTAKREIDAAGMLVTPGAVDIHVHMQMSLPGGIVSADSFFTGTRAAAFGGTTTIIDFVAPEPDESMVAALAARRAEADPNVVIDYALHMTLSPHELRKLDEMAAVVAAGVTSFKLYMAYGFRLNDGELLQALAAVKKVGGMPVVHAENWDVITTLVAENVAAGRTEPHWHPRSRPALLEGEAAGTVIDIAEYVGTPVHIFHVSCAAVVERIRAARGRGLSVTGETCPQYLFLTWDAYDAPGVDGALPVCAPPLRPQADQAALWAALAAGDLQIVTTDHCPFTRAEKAAGLAQNFSRIPGGVPSIEMRFPALYSAVRDGRLTPQQWVDLCCTTPARLMGLSHKGEIAVGKDADIVIFNPERPYTLSTDSLHENCDWTPYQGMSLQGWPEVTLSHGEVVVERGKFVGAAGNGRFLKRKV